MAISLAPTIAVQRDTLKTVRKSFNTAPNSDQYRVAVALNDEVQASARLAAVQKDLLSKPSFLSLGKDASDLKSAQKQNAVDCQKYVTQGPQGVTGGLVIEAERLVDDTAPPYGCLTRSWNRVKWPLLAAGTFLVESYGPLHYAGTYALTQLTRHTVCHLPLVVSAYVTSTCANSTGNATGPGTFSP